MTDDRMTELRANLELFERFRDTGAPPGAWLKEAFVLRMGAGGLGIPRPRGIKRGIPKACFRNTAVMVRRRKHLTYVEGFAWCPRVPFPVHHAWAIDPAGTIIDPTLGDPEDCAYLGVPIPPADYAAETWDGRPMQRLSSSVFIDAIGMINAAYMVRRCPDLAALLPQKEST